MSELFDPFVFSLGMVALLNPCGFALLPAYLGFFMGQDDVEPSRLAALNRAQGVGLAMTLGFLSVFGVLGFVLTGFRRALVDWLPYFNVVLGVGLVGLGVAMLAGKSLKLNLPSVGRGGGSGSFGSMFVFGVSYALASLSCTIGLFLLAVGSTSSGSGGFVESFGGFISYGLGMGLLATVVTLAVAFGKRSLVNKFRSVLPRINAVSALLLLLVGPYMILYGVWEIQLLNRPFDEVTPWLDSFMGEALGFQADISTWIGGRWSIAGWSISRTGALGWTFFVFNAAILIAAYIARSTKGHDSSGPEETSQTSDGHVVPVLAATAEARS